MLYKRASYRALCSQLCGGGGLFLAKPEPLFQGRPPGFFAHKYFHSHARRLRLEKPETKNYYYCI